MEVKKLFALASVTALTGFVASGLTAACSSTEVVTVPNEAGTSSSGAPGKDAGKTGKTSSSGSNGDDDDSTGDDDTQGDDDTGPTDDDDATGDDDDMAAPTCLSKDPIDATKFPYTKSIKGIKGACTTKELSDFSAYYKAHATEDDVLDTWPTSVGAKCASCIFTDDTGEEPATAWGPMVIGLDSQMAKTFVVNRGGCIEAVSGKEDCGRAYQNFQDCTLQACLKDCKTQAEFTKCRQDPAVLTTSCKDAFTALKSTCGEKMIGGYETACKGTTYTFEGPIKVLCIQGQGGTIKDAGGQ